MPCSGFAFVNPVQRFVGHAVCDSVEWINGLSDPVTESYHPNRTGQSSGYTPLVSRVLTGSSVAATSAVLAKAVASAGSLATQQRQYAAADATVTPKPFLAPDLSTPSARAAARSAGVDPGNRASVDAADRAYAAAQGG